MKNLKFSILFAATAMLLAGCAKEQYTASLAEGGVQEVTFTAAVAGDVTKAVFDNDGRAASVNRCIMEIYYGDDLFTRMYSKVTDKQASFTTQLVANRTYKVAFWADHVADASSDEGLATDLYYTTTSLKAVSLNGDYVGNSDARDAFALCKNYTVAQQGGVYAAVLRRPFAQVNVITTDVQTVAKLGGLKPDQVTLTLYDAVSCYNVIDSTAVSDQTANLTYTADVYKWNADTTACTLSMDYLFAEKTKALIDIDWAATKANNADVQHTFASVPYQRNYRTNIKGALLTTTGQWNVTVEPEWINNGTGEFEVLVLVANTVEKAQELINANAGDNSVSKTVEIQVKEEISDVTELYIPDNTTTPNWVFKIEDMTAQGQIVVKDEHPADESVNYKRSAEVALPSGTTASQTTFNTPNAHGVVSGDFGRIDATTSATTLEVKADATVDAIYVHQGNIALYGAVDHIYRAEGNTATVTVNIYDGAVWTNWESEKASTGIKPIVNLGTYTFDPTGYNVDGSTVTDNGDQTWTVSVTNEWQYYAAKEFSNASGTTITIMNAAELALFAKNINSNANYTGYTIKLGADIDLGGHNWNPIMLNSNNGTNITIDGAGRTISGLTINRTEKFSGLFGTFFSAGTVIENITIKNPSVTQTVGTDYTAALCGHIGNGTVDNCTVIGGTISGVEQVGAIVGNLECGNVYNCVVNGTVISGVNRVGGISGKANVDSGYRIIGNTVKNATISSTERHDLSGAAAIVAQVMTGADATWVIEDNVIENVTTTTGSDNTFVPVGEFRNGSFRSDAFTGGHIVNNTWDEACADTDRYNMVNPANTSESVTIWNGTPVVWAAYAASSYSTPIADSSDVKIVTISSAAEFALFAKSPVNGVNAAGKHTVVKLTSDIDLGAHIWESVKMTCVDFYGKGHTVSNVTVVESTQNSGLFGDASIYTIKDLTVDNANIQGINHVAAIAGNGLCGHLINCHATNCNIVSKVKDNDDGDKAGAICGYLSGESDAEITGCSAVNCTITAYRDLGSIVGYVNETANVTGNTATGCQVICDQSNNYNNYTSNSQYDANEIIGEIVNTSTQSGNTATGVTVSYTK